MILHRLLACHELLPLKEFLSGWFQGAAWEDIKRENAREFLAYGFFTSPLEALPAEVSIRSLTQLSWLHHAAQASCRQMHAIAAKGFDWLEL